MPLTRLLSLETLETRALLATSLGVTSTDTLLDTAKDFPTGPTWSGQILPYTEAATMTAGAKTSDLNLGTGPTWSGQILPYTDEVGMYANDKGK